MLTEPDPTSRFDKCGWALSTFCACPIALFDFAYLLRRSSISQHLAIATAHQYNGAFFQHLHTIYYGAFFEPFATYPIQNRVSFHALPPDRLIK